jgi:mannose-1-phosphate guanylyltransferase
VTPSDHIIGDEKAYEKALDEAFDLAEKDYLVTFGIRPTKPEIGYGYIQSEGSNVVAFHEKPNKDKAKSFVEAGNYLWNSGIFCFKAKTYLEELSAFRPDILEACKSVMNLKQSDFLDEAESKKIPSESIDYAVMEHSKKIKVVKGTFEWSDLGTFEALYDYFSTKNAYVQNSNLVIAETAHVELHGLENTMVIQSGGSILVMPIEQSQEVKKIYQRLLKTNTKLIE